MRVNSVPMTDGMAWFQRGIRILQAAPLRWAFVLTFAFASIFLLMGIPVIGWLLIIAVQPLFTLGLTTVFRQAERNQGSPELRNFFEPFRLGAPIVIQLLTLGAIYGLIMLLVGELTGDPFADLLKQQAAKSPPDPKAIVTILSDPNVQTVMLIKLLSGALVSGLFWFAPMFIGWDRIPLGKACFFSVIAAWRNKGALVLFFLLLVLLSVITISLTVAFGLLVGKLMGGSAQTFLVQIGVFGAVTVLFALIFSGTWHSYEAIVRRANSESNV